MRDALPPPPEPPVQPGYGEAVRWLEVVNTLSEDIPGGAALRVTGSASAYDYAPEVAKPNADSMFPVLIAHPMGIPASGRGLATFDDFVPALYSGTVSTLGTEVGTASGQWYLLAGNRGYVTAAPANGQGLVEVARRPVWNLKGKLDGTLSFGGSATVSIWQYNGSSEVDTTFNVTAYDWHLSSGQTIASGSQVWVGFDGVRWYVTQGQCS